LQPDDPVVLENPVILDIAKKYNKTPGQICIKWAAQRNLVVIPKSVTPSRIHENANIFDFILADIDMNAIKKLEKGFRYYGWVSTKSHKLYPFEK